jgi:ribonucleases P/MRP protein subunit RPP40
MDEGYGVDGIYLDDSKAFDSVSHSKLLGKIKLLSVPEVIANWIGSFLKDRKMRVSLESERSFWAEVLSGVPQGSVLGPLLFLIFANDLPDWVFADDTKIWRKIKHMVDSESLQEDLHKLAE